jgi:hypothetical protein
MPPVKNHDLQKHTLNLRRGDVDRIRELHPNIESAVVIRRLISNYVDEFKTTTQFPRVTNVRDL